MKTRTAAAAAVPKLNVAPDRHFTMPTGTILLSMNCVQT
jgi:hypothetical protein